MSRKVRKALKERRAECLRTCYAKKIIGGLCDPRNGDPRNGDLRLASFA